VTYILFIFIRNITLTNDVVCVWVGDKYSEDYVTNLYEGVAAHTTYDFRFNVITDKPEIAKKIPCRVIPIPNWKELGIKIFDHRKAWWFKMCMFDPANAFGKNVLYMDLDVTIIRNIDKFFGHEPKKFSILQDFNRQYIPDYHVSNSSIMRWNPKRFSGIWKDFDDSKRHNVAHFRGDQDYLTAYFARKENSKYKAWWPREWAMSWKWELEKGGKRNNGTDRNSYIYPDKPFVIPPECAVVVCHGDPKPSDINKEIRAEWINN